MCAANQLDPTECPASWTIGGLYYLGCWYTFSFDREMREIYKLWRIMYEGRVGLPAFAGQLERFVA